jgi:hypothetical protein
MILNRVKGEAGVGGVRCAKIAKIIMIPNPRNRCEGGDPGMRIGDRKAPHRYKTGDFKRDDKRDVQVDKTKGVKRLECEGNSSRHLLTLAACRLERSPP